MHVGLVWMDGHKMSKSLGNLVFIDKLRASHDPRAIRLGLIEHHYRNDWHWEPDLVTRNEDRFARWQAAADGSAGPALDEVRVALDDDMHTPRALAAIDAAVERGEGVREAAALLGIPLD
jgi:L-cysteine:1D-myo-inositol 2-amino-2-deoxy-alpha-D-glucopyranoside ligase